MTLVPANESENWGLHKKYMLDWVYATYVRENSYTTLCNGVITNGPQTGGLPQTKTNTKLCIHDPCSILCMLYLHTQTAPDTGGQHT